MEGISRRTSVAYIGPPFTMASSATASITGEIHSFVFTFFSASCTTNDLHWTLRIRSRKSFQLFKSGLKIVGWTTPIAHEWMALDLIRMALITSPW